MISPYYFAKHQAASPQESFSKISGLWSIIQSQIFEISEIPFHVKPEDISDYFKMLPFDKLVHIASPINKHSKSPFHFSNSFVAFLVISKFFCSYLVDC